MRAFEPLTLTQYLDAATASYLRAFALLEVGDAAAITAFASHVCNHPNDRLASFHLRRRDDASLRASGGQVVASNLVNEYVNRKRVIDHITAVVLIVLVRLEHTAGVRGTSQQRVLPRLFRS
jgi:hypothetical protein